VLGLCVGSFLNVVIYRLPIIMENNYQDEINDYTEKDIFDPKNRKINNLYTQSSFCQNCGHKIRWFENIPFFSYLFLKGKCSSCKQHFSIRYPLIELVTSVLFGLCAYGIGFNLSLLFAFVFISLVISLFFIDYDTYYLPDDLVYLLLWAGLLINTINPGLYSDNINASLFGAILGYMSLWTIYKLFKLLTGKEGMGYGDFKMNAALLAWFGWTAFIKVLLLSAVSASVIGIGFLFYKKESKPIPFGPFLAIAGIIVLFEKLHFFQIPFLI
jgi:leader peptidase (prepilin peptidase)/N-methyltransferase